MDIGIRELKNRLSEAVQRASRGETIRITDRGKAKAILGPIPGRGRIDEGLQEGWIKQQSNAPPIRVRPVSSDSRIAEVLDEDRGV